MIPVCAVLRDGEAIGEGVTCANAREADARNAIHMERHKQTVPVNTGVDIQHIMDAQRNVVALTEANERRRDSAVYTNRLTRPAINIDRKLTDMQIELGRAVMHMPHIAVRRRLRPGRKKAGGAERGGNAHAGLQKMSSIKHGKPL